MQWMKCVVGKHTSPGLLTVEGTDVLLGGQHRIGITCCLCLSSPYMLIWLPIVRRIYLGTISCGSVLRVSLHCPPSLTKVVPLSPPWHAPSARASRQVLHDAHKSDWGSCWGTAVWPVRGRGGVMCCSLLLVSRACARKMARATCCGLGGPPSAVNTSELRRICTL